MSKKQILVVEDDREIRALLKQILEQEGYCVWTASNGQEALRKLGIEDANQKTDLILLDLMMPVMNGWEFLKAAEPLLRDKSIPIVTMSAGVHDPTLIPQFVREKLKKPLDVETLLEAVSRHCEGECS